MELLSPRKNLQKNIHILYMKYFVQYFLSFLREKIDTFASNAIMRISGDYRGKAFLYVEIGYTRDIFSCKTNFVYHD